MEEFVSVSPKVSSFLAVPCPPASISKARSYSDTSIFQAISEKNRTYTQTKDDTCRLSPSPSLKAAGSIEAPVETSTLKPKRKTSRPRSPFSGEKAFDLLAKFAKNDFVAKITSSSPKLRPRRTRSKGKGDGENRESVSSKLIQLLPIFLLGYKKANV